MSECSYVDIKHCDKASDFNGHAGDLIIAMTGATLGKVCIIPYHTTDYYINQRVGKFFLGDTICRTLLQESDRNLFCCMIFLLFFCLLLEVDLRLHTQLPQILRFLNRKDNILQKLHSHRSYHL